MFDFAALPPEVNSTRMYTGPGSGPLMAAAAGWDALAAQLESFAAGYASVLTSLQGQSWSGPASAAMNSAATPYVAWANTTATQAEQTAGQARAAAAAYETAHAATVPPAAVAANRFQLAVLVATNFFGQNAPAIAANEAAYSEMWAQDAAAMHGYAEASRPATTLSHFQQPPQTTNPAGQSAQNAAVGQATGSSAGENTQSVLSHALSGMPQHPQTFSTPQGANSTGTDPSSLLSGLFDGGKYNGYDALDITTEAPNQLIVQVPHTVGDLGQFMAAGIGKFNTDALKIGATAPKPMLAGESLGAGSSPIRGAVLASAGNATPMGNLSVPQSWSATTQATTNQPSTLQLSGASSRAAAAQMGNAPRPAMGQLPMPLKPTGHQKSRSEGATLTRMRERRFRMPRPPAAG